MCWQSHNLYKTIFFRNKCKAHRVNNLNSIIIYIVSYCHLKIFLLAIIYPTLKQIVLQSHVFQSVLETMMYMSLSLSLCDWNTSQICTDLFLFSLDRWRAFPYNKVILFQKQLLFGFIYIPEVQYFTNHCTTYFKIQSFSQNETLCSKLVTNTENSFFDFHQVSNIYFTYLTL